MFNYSQYQQQMQPAMMNPYQFRLNSLQGAAEPQHIEIVKVSGENGAKAYQMPPNSSILLLDETQPLIWLKTTDGAGYPTITAYAITPYQPEVPVDTSALEGRISAIEKKLEELNNEQSYVKSAKSDSKQGSPTAG